MNTKSYTKTRFSANDAALVLIDHQSGVMQLVHDYSPAEFRNNVIGLAKLGRVFNLPTVLTTRLLPLLSCMTNPERRRRRRSRQRGDEAGPCTSVTDSSRSVVVSRRFQGRTATFGGKKGRTVGFHF